MLMVSFKLQLLMANIQTDLCWSQKCMFIFAVYECVKLIMFCQKKIKRVMQKKHRLFMLLRCPVFHF